jgi:signal transduction histidine kinase
MSSAYDHIRCKFFLFAFSLLFSQQGLSQSVLDSLLKMLPQMREDTVKVNVLNDIAWEYIEVDLDKADSFSQKAIHLSNTLSFVKGRSSAYNTLGLVYRDKSDLKKALEYFFLALADKKKLGDRKGAATILSNIGITYRAMTQYKMALKYLDESLAERKLLDDLRGESDCLNNIGNVYSETGNFDEALSNYNKCLQMRKRIKYFGGMAQTYNNLSGVYHELGDYRQELNFFYRSAGILDSLGMMGQLAIVYANIAAVNRTLNNYPDAIKYCMKSIELGKKYNSETVVIEPLIILGDVYYDYGQLQKSYACFQEAVGLMEKNSNLFYLSHGYNGMGLCLQGMRKSLEAEQAFKTGLEATRKSGEMREILNSLCQSAGFYLKMQPEKKLLPMLDEALHLAQQNHYRDFQKKIYKLYAEYYSTNLHQPDKAVEYYSKCLAITDSLFTDDVALTLARQQTRFETEKKEAQIKLLRQQDAIKSLQLEEQALSVQKRNYMLTVLCLFVLLMLISGYFYISRQKLKQAEIRSRAIRETEEKERLRLAKDIHDDLGSGLSKIKVLSELIAARAKNDPEIHSQVSSVSETSVRLVENMRDLIWALNPENATTQRLAARIREYCTDYLGDFPIELRAEVAEAGEDVPIIKEAHRHIFYIVKEAVQNIIKHAQAKTVKLQVSVTEEYFNVLIEDDGRGLQNAGESGNGLANMKRRSEYMQASFSLTAAAGAGLSMSLSVPVKNIRIKSV